MIPHSSGKLGCERGGVGGDGGRKKGRLNRVGATGLGAGSSFCGRQLRGVVSRGQFTIPVCLCFPFV